MYKLLASWYIQIYTNLYSSSKVFSQLTMYSDAIKGTFASSSLIADAYKLFLTISIGLMLLYFTISWGTSVMNKENTPTSFFVAGLKLFVALCLALKGFDIVREMFVLGDGLGELINTGVPSVEAFSPELEIALANSIKKIDITSQIGYVFKALFPLLLCVASDLIIVYVIVSRVLRISICAALSPIALANTFDDTRRSDAVRFLKRTLGMALQLSLIMVISLSVGTISRYMSVSNLANPAEALFGTLEEDGDELSKVETDLDILYGESYENTDSGQEMFDKKVYKTDSNGNFVLDEAGNKVLKSAYQKFDEAQTKSFLDGVLSEGNYWTLLILLFIKMGLIKKSNSMCNTIVGL